MLPALTTVLTLLSLLSGCAGQPEGTAPPQSSHFRVVCYVEGWARYRPDPVQFTPEDVDTSLCTHLIFAFASLDDTGMHIIPADTYSDPAMYSRLTGLRREKPHLKVLLALGGWNMGTKPFTQLVSSTVKMNSFAMNAVEFLHRYGFDGLDLDWEYPADRGSPAGDKQRFTELLQILNKEFARDHRMTNRSNLLLSAAISPAPGRVQHSYELPEIADYVDFLNVLTYDFHGAWESTVGHHSSLYSPSNDQTDSIDYSMNFILNTSVAESRLNLGLAFYGRSLNLSDPSNTAVGAPTNGAAAGGQFTKEPGFLAYYEVCKVLTEQGEGITDSGRLSGTKAPYVVDGTRWIGYDDEQSIREKVDYAIQHGLGGVFIWSISMDDFHGICGGGHYPLLTAIKQEVHQALVG